MSLPEVAFTITDGALGILPSSSDYVSAKIGCCSSGTVNTVYGFTDQGTVVSTLGSGPLVEALCHQLAVAGGIVYGVRATGTTAGSNSAVTQSGTGPVVSVAGTPLDAYDVKIKIIVGGALATATMKYSLDGGVNYSQEIATAATYVIAGTGLTLTMASGTYAAAEVYSFTAVAPVYDATSLGVAMTALFAAAYSYKFVHIVGQVAGNDAAAKATACATVAGAVDVALVAAAAAYRYTRAIVEGPDIAQATLAAAFTAVAPTRVMVSQGFATYSSMLTGRSISRSSAWTIAARMGMVPVHEDLGRVMTGALTNVTAINYDERATPGGDANRLATLRTFIGLPGFYITAGRTLATALSDYQLIQYGFVMDKLCGILRTALLRYLNDSVRVDATTGFILEVEAQRIEAEVTAKLSAGLIASGNASSIAFTVSRTENMLSSATLRTITRCVPMAYSREIVADVGFKNPALTPVTPS